MDKKGLFLQAIGKFLLGVIIIGLLLFLPAGSLQYWQAWLLMGILFVPMFCAGLVMLAKNPELLRKRLSAKEEEKDEDKDKDKDEDEGENSAFNSDKYPELAGLDNGDRKSIFM